jgi:NADH-quinone oxidoreductase subunit F
MDLRFTGHEATSEERTAIDKVATEPRRDLLLPALHAANSRIGWISPGALNYICRKLEVPPAEAFGVATFYHMFSVTPRPPKVTYVCDDIVCRLMNPKIDPEAKRSPCLGQCERAPASLVTIAGPNPEAYVLPKEDLKQSIPQMGQPGLRLIGRIGRDEPYEFKAWKRAQEMGPQKIIEQVTASKLVGRGGAAFPTGRKWEAVAKAPAKPHYIVCNADESEPGTFKDRLLMEGDPCAVIEGMMIGALATGCERGFIYIRGEYPLAAQRLQKAIDQTRPLLEFDLQIRVGAGAYICGEETALFNSIEGKRGEPRNKPPFPVHVGLFGKPTLVNNVETLVNIPRIILEGGAAFATSETKLFCVSGHVARPGLYEVPFGTTLRQLTEMAGAKSIKAVLLGGAAGSFVGPDKLDTPLTFEGTRAIGATLGSGVVLVLDESVDLADTLLRIAAFFKDESCGQCVPCRVGTQRQEELLHRLRAGKLLGSWAQEMGLLKEISQAMRDASICGLGQTASSAIESALACLEPFPKGKP